MGNEEFDVLERIQLKFHKYIFNLKIYALHMMQRFQSQWEHYQFFPLYIDISVLCKLNSTIVTIWWVSNKKYTWEGIFKAIYRTQVEYSVSVTCQIWQLGTLVYKKDNYVTVLGQMKSDIYWELEATTLYIDIQTRIISFRCNLIQNSEKLKRAAVRQNQQNDLFAQQDSDQTGQMILSKVNIYLFLCPRGLGPPGA